MEMLRNLIFYFYLYTLNTMGKGYKLENQHLNRLHSNPCRSNQTSQPTTYTIYFAFLDKVHKYRKHTSKDVILVLIDFFPSSYFTETIKRKYSKEKGIKLCAWLVEKDRA